MIVVGNWRILVGILAVGGILAAFGTFKEDSATTADEQNPPAAVVPAAPVAPVAPPADPGYAGGEDTDAGAFPGVGPTPEDVLKEWQDWDRKSRQQDLETEERINSIWTGQD